MIFFVKFVSHLGNLERLAYIRTPLVPKVHLHSTWWSDATYQIRAYFEPDSCILIHCVMAWNFLEAVALGLDSCSSNGD